MQPPHDPAKLHSIELRLNSWLPRARQQALDEAGLLGSLDRLELCIRIMESYRAGRLWQSRRLAAVFIFNGLGLLSIFADPHHPGLAYILFSVWVLLLVSTVFGGPARAYASVPELLDDAEDPRTVRALIAILRNPPQGKALDYRGPERALAVRRRDFEHKLTSSQDPLMLPAFVDIVLHTKSFARTKDQNLLRQKALDWLSNYSLTEPLIETDKEPLLMVLQDPYRDADLTVAIISAAPRLGLTSAFSRITALSHDLGATPHMLAVRAAAQNALPLLQEAVERERRAETLLRPSNKPEGAASPELLRAALHEKPDDKPEELLRADR